MFHKSAAKTYESYLGAPPSSLGFSGDMKRLFREILFLGQNAEIEDLSRYLRSLDVPEWSDLALRLEALLYFRAHYATAPEMFPEMDRAKIARYDADWTMQILAMIEA